MIKTDKRPNNKLMPKLVAVIRNAHTDAELDEMEERWANHTGPYMTVAETLAFADEQAQKRAANS